MNGDADKAAVWFLGGNTGIPVTDGPSDYNVKDYGKRARTTTTYANQPPLSHGKVIFLDHNLFLYNQ